MQKERMMNKKGSELLQSETVKILIGVICISFLIYFSYLIYQASTQKNEIRQASSALEEIGLRFEKLNEGEKAIYLYLAPRKYYFKVIDSINKVGNYNYEYGLCLCNKEDCSDIAICRKMNKSPLVLISDKIETPKSLLLSNTGGYYEISSNPTAK